MTHRILALVALAAMLTGCSSASTQEVLGSRATIYTSVEDLAADSTAIVTATVTTQREASISGATGTLSQLTLLAEPATQIVVFQYGAEVVSATAPLLVQGQAYLLFLTADELPGDGRHEFWVTGGSAGIYESTGDGYVRRGTDPDVLPEVISETEAQTLLRWD